MTRQQQIHDFVTRLDLLHHDEQNGVEIDRGWRLDRMIEVAKLRREQALIDSARQRSQAKQKRQAA